MVENKIDITIVPWSTIYKELPINHSNKGFFKLINEIYSKLDEKDAFVYYADYEFGEKIISDGNIPIHKFQLKNINNNFKKNNNNFKNDINYSTDPLGIVASNEAVIISNSNSIRLGLLEQGQLLGVFGTLDYLNFDKSNVFGNKDWNVFSGDPSFHFIFSFGLLQNDLISKKYFRAYYETEIKDNKTILKKRYEKFVYDKDKPIIAQGIDLVNLLEIETSNTRVIYIPKHIFNEIHPNILENKHLNLRVKNYIYQKGWEQSKPIRNLLFEDGEINNLIKGIEDLYNEESLIQLYVLCYHISRGEKESLMLLTNSDKTETKIFKKFKSSNEGHFEQSSSNYPLILKHKKIKTKNDFGIISLNHLPIKNITPFKNLARTIDGFKAIQEKLNNKFKFEFEFYNYKKSVRNCKNIHRTFIDELKKNSSIKEFKIPNDEYDRLLIIKSSLKNTFPEYFVLNKLKKEFKNLEFDLSDYYIISVQHLLRSTGSLFEALIDIGFTAKNIYLTGKIYSTHKETEELLKEDLGINVFESTIKDELGVYSKGLEEDIARMWELLLEEIKDKPNSKIIVLDDGGYTLKSVNRELLKKHTIFGIEQTTSGIEKSPSFEKFPIIDVAASAAKVLIEPLLVSEAVNIQLHEQFLKIKPNNIGIIGYGHIGKAIAQEYKEKGYNIFIFDDEKNISKKEKHINQCETSWELYQKSDIIIGATGKDITDNRWINESESNKVFMSVSSGDIEFNRLISENIFEDLDSKENLKKPFPLRIKEFKTTNNKEENYILTLLRGGMVSNFTGSADSSPGEYIQITRGLLFSAIIQIIKNEKELKNNVIKLDAELQQKVVKDWFSDQPQKKMDYSSETLEVFEKINLINKESGGI